MKDAAKIRISEQTTKKHNKIIALHSHAERINHKPFVKISEKTHFSLCSHEQIEFPNKTHKSNTCIHK